MRNRFKSRKFWMAVVTGLIIIANEGLDLRLPTESILTVAGVVIAFILGESAVDYAAVKKG